MSRPCRICISEHVVQIDSLLALGHGPHAISRAHPDWPSAYAIERHRRAEHHLKVMDDVKGDSTAELDKWLTRADALYLLAEEKHDVVKMNTAVTMAAKFLEMKMRRSGELLTDSARREMEVKRGKAEVPDQGIPLQTLDQIMRSVSIKKLEVVGGEDA
jgi:hypothetical protein